MKWSRIISIMRLLVTKFQAVITFRVTATVIAATVILVTIALPLVTNNLKPTNSMGYNGVSLIMKEMNELSFNDRNYLTETTSYVSYDCNDCPSECDCTDSDCVMTS